MGDSIDGGTGGSIDISPLVESINEAERQGDLVAAAADRAILRAITEEEED